MKSHPSILQREHDRLDRSFANYLAALEAGSDKVTRRLSRFVAVLERHLWLEETVLFPYAERLAPGDADGTLVFLKAEHQRIRAAMIALRTTEDAAAARVAATWLAATLWRHEQVEDRVLSPWLDSHLSEPQRRTLLDLLRHAA